MGADGDSGSGSADEVRLAISTPSSLQPGRFARDPFHTCRHLSVSYRLQSDSREGEAEIFNIAVL